MKVTETKYDALNITNTRTPNKYDVKGTKTWDHGKNPEANQPKEIEVSLVYGESREEGTAIEETTQTVKADEKGNWSYSWTLNADERRLRNQV